MKMQHFGIQFRTHEPDFSNLNTIEQDWFSVHGDVTKALPSNAPKPLGKGVQLTHCVDANLLHAVLTDRSVTACLHFVNGTPIDWHSKKQATVETAACSSKFVAARTCIEQTINLCNTLRCLGVEVREKSFMFGDNESVVNSASIVHSKLHKCHNALSFHHVREATASRHVDFNCIPGMQNPADILSKQWACSAVKDVLLPLFHQHGETCMDQDDQGEQSHSIICTGHRAMTQGKSMLHDVVRKPMMGCGFVDWGAQCWIQRRMQCSVWGQVMALVEFSFFQYGDK